MIITYHGQAFVRCQVGDTVVAFNPGSVGARFGADVVLVSLSDQRFKGGENLTGGGKEPFIIDGPGAYEVGGIFIEGLASPGANDYINTIYALNLDGMRVCHLGVLATLAIDPEALESIGAVDILFVPIGGGDRLSAKEAAKIAASLEPKIVIPVLYSGESDPELKIFLKEIGEEGIKAVDKLAIKRRDLETKEGEVVLLLAE
ncbi:MAG: MBL fold metallo-hydrolase [Candidatus Vogelbacteria bacterium]|nr:MBL fold metallo-hydrolase [Candidatus Vogelbacteria bacterium]